ncbi:hypothetical protein, partial [Aeromonas sobria]|uniref:hypothetical protein n=1 Tax=Aeromonas sobria TaxID=646 RepID=UPI003F3B4688
MPFRDEKGSKTCCSGGVSEPTIEKKSTQFSEQKKGKKRGKTGKKGAFSTFLHRKIEKKSDFHPVSGAIAPETGWKYTTVMPHLNKQKVALRNLY